MGWDRSKTALWFAISLALTVALTAVLWFVFHVPGLIGFLFLPFLFYGARLFGGKQVSEEKGEERKKSRDARTCPACGRPPREPWDRYCPHDGSYLR